MLKKEDVEKIVSAELGKEPAIRTVKVLKSWTFKVAVIVGAAAITAVLVFGRDMYVAHRPADTKQGAVKQ